MRHFGVDSHLDRVFLMAVNKGKSLSVLLDAINGHTHLVGPRARLQDGDVVDSLPISIVNLERFPTHRETC